ncbi:MAG: hypothetical protein H3C43_07515 [Leptonema sp. (in: Bacteria)]|nr:hypothetical protein [Leptonema sp. (in: bacteria)]
MLTLKKDMLMADGIDRSEQFVYDHSRRLIEATGPYGNRNAPRRTIHYAYGVDGQPIVADEKAYRYDVSNRNYLFLPLWLLPAIIINRNISTFYRLANIQKVNLAIKTVKISG